VLRHQVNVLVRQAKPGRKEGKEWGDLGGVHGHRFAAQILARFSQ
jgi:hypothetical protein